MKLETSSPAMPSLADIVIRSQSLLEYLKEGNISDDLAERWNQQIGQKLASRLNWTKASGKTPENTADWSSAMASLAAALPDLPDANESTKALPFAELLGPTGHWIKRHYSLQWAEFAGVLTPSAEADLLRLLLERLAMLVAPAWQQAFSETLPYGLQQFTKMGGAATLTYEGDEYYQAFIHTHRTSGLFFLWDRFPALARLFFMVLEQSLASLADMLGDFQRDWPKLAAWHGLEAACPRVQALEACGSDWHHGNREVMRLEAAGRRFIYKPRSCALEAAWADAVEWLNRELGTSLRAAHTLDFGNHGWMEWIDHTACESDTEVSEYYENAGLMLALLWLLRGSDIHYENLIAAGPSPVLVDAEALLWQEPAHADSLTPLEQQYINSVLRIGLLPQWRTYGRTACDISGLGHFFPLGEMTVRRWCCLGRDTQHFGHMTAMPPAPGNIVLLDKQAKSPSAYVPMLVQGFRWAARHILSRREQLLSADSPLQRFRNAPSRFIFRSTSIYSSLLAESLLPSVLTDGISRSLVFEKLAKALLGESEPPPIWPLLDHEIDALTRADIPFFTAPNDETGITYPGGRIDGVFSETAWDCLTRQYSEWNPELLELQVRLIETAYAPPLRELLVLPNYTQEDSYLPLACRIAETICQQVVPDRNGVNWIAFSVSQDNECHLAPLPPGWYGGVAGIATFLAQAHCVSGERRFREIAEAAVQPWLAELDQLASLGLGLASGAGGLIYALSRLALDLEDETYAALARQLGSKIPRGQITGDRHLDIIGGSAGLLIALARLAEIRPDPVLLDLGRQCASHLLASSQTQPGGGLAWPTLPGHCIAPLTGFSHGASGIACALLGWNRIDPQTIIAGVVRRAMDYERSVYSDIASNWPDFRNQPDGNNTPRHQCAWCHGAPGIALARLAAMQQFDWPELQSDLELAINATVGANHLPANLCCGDFGVADILLTCAIALNRPELASAAKIRINSALTSLQSGETGLLPPGVEGTAFNPGLFTGLAGIGYALFRQASPHKLPSLLACR